MAAGEMSPAEFTKFLATAFKRLADFSTNGSIHFVFQDWRHMREVLDAADCAYSELKNLCVWVKTNGGIRFCAALNRCMISKRLTRRPD